MIAENNELEQTPKTEINWKPYVKPVAAGACVGLFVGTLLTLRYAKIHTVHIMPSPDQYAKMVEDLKNSGTIMPYLSTLLRGSILVKDDVLEAAKTATAVAA